MTTMFRSRQRAEEFNALVDGTSTVRRAADPQLEQLVGVAHALRTHSTQFAEATPRDDFVAELRERLMTEAATVLSPAQSSLASFLPSAVTSKGSSRGIVSSHPPATALSRKRSR